jgi:hypothetical protein
MHDDGIWGGNWRVKLTSRLRALGCTSVTEALASFPAEPYIQVAQSLGDDVAALQLEWIQFEEAKRVGRVRQVAMDSLVRDLNRYLPDGWRGAKGDFDTASVFGTWATRLEQNMPELEPRARAVWKALKALHPPLSWSPAGPGDPFIVEAFSQGWPETGIDSTEKSSAGP